MLSILQRDNQYSSETHQWGFRLGKPSCIKCGIVRTLESQRAACAGKSNLIDRVRQIQEERQEQ